MLRAQPPAIYNEERVLERPIPNIGEPVNELDQQIKQEFIELDAFDFGKLVQIMDDDNDQAEQEDLEQNEPIVENPSTMQEPLESSNAVGSQNVSINPIMEDPLELANGGDPNDDSDIALLSFDGEFPKPMQLANGDLVKRENDCISGNLSFTDRVSTFFFKSTN